MRLVSSDNNLGRRLLSSYANAVRDCHGDPFQRRAALEAKKAEHGVDDEYCERILQSCANGKAGARPTGRATTPGPIGTEAAATETTAAALTASASGAAAATAAAMAAAAHGGDAVATITTASTAAATATANCTAIATAAGVRGVADTAAIVADGGMLVDGATSPLVEAGGIGRGGKRAAVASERPTRSRKAGGEAQSAPLPGRAAGRLRTELADVSGSSESGQADEDSDGTGKRTSAGCAPLGPILAAAVADVGLAADSAAAGGRPVSRADGGSGATGSEPLLWPLAALESRLRLHLAAAAAAGGGGGGRDAGAGYAPGAVAVGGGKAVLELQPGGGRLHDERGAAAAHLERRLHARPLGPRASHDGGHLDRRGASAGVVIREGLGLGQGLGLRAGAPSAPALLEAAAAPAPGHAVASAGQLRHGAGGQPYVPLRTMSATATSATLGARSGLLAGLSEAPSVTAPMRGESIGHGSCRPFRAAAAAAMTSSIPTAPTSTPASSSAAAAAAADAAAMVPRELMAVALKQAAAAATATAAVAGLAFDSPSHIVRSSAPGVEARSRLAAAASARSAPADEEQDLAAAYYHPLPLHKRQRHESPPPPRSRQPAPPLPPDLPQPLWRATPLQAAGNLALVRMHDHAHNGDASGVDRLQLLAQSKMLVLRPLGVMAAPTREVMVPVLLAPPSSVSGPFDDGDGFTNAGGDRGRQAAPQAHHTAMPAHLHGRAGPPHSHAADSLLPTSSVSSMASAGEAAAAAASRLQQDVHKALLRQQHQQQVQQLEAQQRLLEQQLLQTRVRQLLMLQTDEPPPSQQQQRQQQQQQQQQQQSRPQQMPPRKRTPADDAAEWLAAHVERRGAAARGQEQHQSLAAALHLAAHSSPAGHWDLEQRVVLPVRRPPPQSQPLPRATSEMYGLELLSEVADEAANAAGSARSAPAHMWRAPAQDNPAGRPLMRLGTGRSYDVGGTGSGGGG